MSASAERAAGTLQVLLSSARMQVFQTLAAPTTVIFGFVQPAVLLLVTLLPLDHPTPVQATHIVTGVLLTSFWTATAWGSASVLRQDRAMGTLIRSVGGVRDPRLVVVGKGLGSSLLAIVLVSLTAGLFLLLLRQPVAVARPGWFAVGLVAVLASGAAVGLLIGSVFVLTRYGPQVSSALMYPVFLLGGMLIPVDFVPAGLRWLSYGISLRWLQAFLAGAAEGSLKPMALLLAVVLTVVYGLLGAMLFQRMLTRARREATLDLF